MIPIVLSGDCSYNKDAMRRYVHEGSRIIHGDYMEDEFGQTITEGTIKSVIRNLTNESPSGPEKEKYKHCVLLEETEGRGYVLSSDFKKMLEHAEFKEMILELINYGITEAAEPGICA